MKKLIVTLALLALLTARPMTISAAEKLKEVRIATQPSLSYIPIFVAKQKHWLDDDLKKDGITIKWTSFISGPPENESFAAGQQDIGFAGDTPVIILRSAGVKIHIVGVASVGPKTIALVAARNSGIKTLADLKGKRIGVTKGSIAHDLLYSLLQKANLKIDDIKVVHLQPADLINAFNHGDIDAGAAWEPFLGKLEENGTRIADGTGLKQGLRPIFVRDEFASANPELVAKLLKAYQRGYEFAKAHPQEAAQLVAPEVRLPPEQIFKVISNFNYNPIIRPECVSDLKRTEAFLRNHNLSRSRVDIDAFIDTRYLKQAGLR
jgi:sulfonate transport system substrate-binding protein